MQLNERDIREFQKLWREEFGEDVPPEVARERASQLLELYTRLLGRGGGSA